PHSPIPSGQRWLASQLIPERSLSTRSPTSGFAGLQHWLRDEQARRLSARPPKRRCRRRRASQRVSSSELPEGWGFDVPRRTGVSVTVKIMDRLAENPTIVALKESSKDFLLL